MACLGIGAVLLLLFAGRPLWRAANRACGALCGAGFRVTYYRGTAFDEPVCRRTEPRASKDYGSEPPARGVPVDGYSVRWEATLEVPGEAAYDFFLQAAGGSRLFIDGRMVVDRWDQEAWAGGRLGSVRLGRGPHEIRIEHRKTAGRGALVVKWEGGEIPGNTVLGVPHVRKKAASP